MQPSTHLVNNGADRALGATWERAFCLLASMNRRAFTPTQIGKQGSATWHRRDGGSLNTYLLPDVTIWTAPGEHHEIKHKSPTGGDCYGLEKYRLDSLLAFRDETQQGVYYTIHDWRLAGAASSRDEMPNQIEHWRTVEVGVLLDALPQAVSMPTYYGGTAAELPGYYWPTSLWWPLKSLWADAEADWLPF